MSANNRKPRTKQAAAKPAPDKKAPQKAPEAAPATGRAEALDNWFRPKLPLLFAVSMALTLLLGLFFFDPKVSIGGDDSTYLNRAWNFIHQGDFPAFQGPFYPILIGLLMTVTGVNVVLFKILSLLFLAGHLWFFYAVFRKYLPPAITGLLLLILATNHTLLVYGGSTYTEPIYLLLQGLFIWLFDRLILSGAAARVPGIGHLKPFLLAGLLAFLLAFTRNIGLVGLIAALVYFALGKQWKAAGLFLAAFLLFQAPVSLAKRVLWHSEEAQMSGQLNNLLWKDPYNASAGQEDFAGFVQRFSLNSQYYLSYHLPAIFGLRSTATVSKSVLVTLAVYALLGAVFWLTYREHGIWTFTALYTAGGLVLTFIILHVYWQQERLVLVFAPPLLALTAYGLHLVFTDKLRKLRLLPVLFLALVLGASLVRTLSRAPEAGEALGHYLKGERFYGYGQDWVTYLQMVEWTAKNLPETAFVADRKPGMAFIYSGGRNFYGIYRVPSEDPDELYRQLKDAGVTHVLVASLKVHPDDKSGRIINTIQRYLSAMSVKYRDKLQLIHTIGEEYPAYLYQLD
jgi:hypothetical protein